MSYILKNRVYIGELHRNGNIYQGKYRLLIDPRLFQRCQDVLHGRNRRTTIHSHTFSGGLIRCAYCGCSMTGERIRRRLNNGGINEHMYYRCSNNTPEEDHPKVRWREEDIEDAIVKELASLRFPPEMAQWFRDSIQAAFDDVGRHQRQQKASLAKRRSELINMQDRLLNGYLSSAIEEGVFKAKTADLKRELAEVEQSLEQTDELDPETPARALTLFDFSQKLVDLWKRSNSSVKREILDCVSLNHAVSNVTLCLVKRKPFDFFAERPFLQQSRGDRT